MLDPINVDENEYGVDWNGPVPEIQNGEYVNIPEIHNILTAEQVRTLHQHVDPFMEDGNFGVNVYLLAVDVVSALCGL